MKAVIECEFCDRGKGRKDLTGEWDGRNICDRCRKELTEHFEEQREYWSNVK